MKTAIVNTKEKSFLAKNSRWYLLVRVKRAAPDPMVFKAKSDAEFSATTVHGLEKSEFRLVKPDKIKQTRAKAGSCVGRRTDR